MKSGRKIMNATDEVALFFSRNFLRPDTRMKCFWKILGEIITHLISFSKKFMMCL